MRLRSLYPILVIIAVFMFLTGCDSIIPNDKDLAEYTCEGCHTSKSTLTRVINALDLEPPDDGHSAPG